MWVLVVPAVLCGGALVFAGCSSSSGTSAGTSGTDAGGDATKGGADTGTGTADTGASETGSSDTGSADASDGGTPPSDGGSGDGSDGAVDPYAAGSVLCGTTSCTSTGDIADAGGCCFTETADASGSACVAGFGSCEPQQVGGQFTTAIQIGCDSTNDCASGVCCYQSVYVSNTVSCKPASSCVHVSASPYSTSSFQACDPNAATSECSGAAVCTPMVNLNGRDTGLSLCLTDCSGDAGTCTAPETCLKNSQGTSSYCQ